MALLTAKPKSRRVAITLRFNDSLITEIKAYSEWASIDRIDDFFDQAARYVLERDKDWIKKESFNKPDSKNAQSVD